MGAILALALYLGVAANRGLPFRPSYDVTVEAEAISGMAPGAEVKLGGFTRVGIVATIDPFVTPTGRSATLLRLTLDDSLEPLPSDTRAEVRPRTALGIQYIAILPGHSPRPLPEGGHIPLSRSSVPVPPEDLMATFDDRTRDAARAALLQLGDGVAGRGAAASDALEAAPRMAVALRAVAERLNEPRTGLDRLIARGAVAAEQLSPVAAAAGRLAGGAADTAAAAGADPPAVRATLERAGPTLDAGSRTFASTRRPARGAPAVARGPDPGAAAVPPAPPAMT